MIHIENNVAFNSIKELHWDEIRSKIAEINPSIAAIIDNINPEKKLPLIHVSYAYGDKILENGEFCLLKIIEKDHKITSQIKNKIQQYFSYSTIPLGFFLDKSCEVFAEAYDRIVPLAILNAGNPIGIYETIDSMYGTENFPIWSARAGARTTFLLPKISNNVNHGRLKKEFGISTIAPKGLFEQIDTFTAISNSSPATRKQWNCNMIFFPDEWFKNINDNSPAWTAFREFLLREYWINTTSRVSKNLPFILQQLSTAINRKRLKPNTYVTDTIRQLLTIGYGLIPGFTTISKDENLVPLKLLTKAYVDVYKIEHAPTIMVPSFLTQGQVYYSMGCPTLMEGNPDMFNLNNTIEYLLEIQYLIKNLIEYCSLQITEYKSFENFIKTIGFSYFHKVKDGDIGDIERLIAEDKSFHTTKKASSDKKICVSSPFFNGCIRISKEIPLK